MEYKSAMVFSDKAFLDGSVKSEHVEKKVQSVLDYYSQRGWTLHSQSICWAPPIGVHFVFQKPK
jgi:hypothetical protein